MRTYQSISLALLLAISACSRGQSEKASQGSAHGASKASASEANPDSRVEIPGLGFESDPSYIADDQVILTFDGSPDVQNTAPLLDVLNMAGVKATFFLSLKGFDDEESVDAKRELVRRMASEGHEIASNTAHDLKLSGLDDARIEAEISGVDKVLQSLTGSVVSLVRSPDGDSFLSSQEESERVLSVINRHAIHVGWNIDSSDNLCEDGDAECLLESIKQQLPGVGQGKHGIIRFRLGLSQTSIALPEIIDYLRSSGYKIVGVEDVLKERYGNSSAQLVGRESFPPIPLTAASCNYPAYKAGTFYKVGTKVVYKSQIFTAQNADNPGYDPKVSSWYWLAGPSCTSVAIPSTPAPTQGSTCSAPAWVAGKYYKQGTTISYKNQLFTAQNGDNPGYDPKISTWFWKAGSLCSGTAPTTPVVTPPVVTQPVVTQPVVSQPVAKGCSSPAWTKKNYNEGDTVVYQGQVFKAIHGSNPGYDPKVSTWFWQAGESCSSSTPKTPVVVTPAPSTCKAWAQGTFYKVGTVVSYKGSNYTAVNVDNPGYDPIISSWYWKQGGSCSGSSTPTPSTPTTPVSGGSGFEAVLSEAQFNKMFPNRIAFYSYQGLKQAADATPGFAKEGSLEDRKREVAAMLANGEHESDGFRAINEYNTAVWGNYCMSGGQYPCASGKTYHGRGPIQLSWNYNYKDAGIELGYDLVNDPDRVARESKVAWQTLMWFWMKRGTVTCHDAIVKGKGGFAQTIRTINGGLECQGQNQQQMLKRGVFYREIMSVMGLPVTENTSCI